MAPPDSSSVWVKLYIKDQETRENSPVEIKPIPEGFNINDLAKAVKETLHPKVEYASLDEILVYPPGTTVTAAVADGDHYKPGKTLAVLISEAPIALDYDNPLIVVAPYKEGLERPRKKRAHESYQNVDSAKFYAESAWKDGQRQPSTTIMHARPPGKTHLPVYIMHKAFDEIR